MITPDRKHPLDIEIQGFVDHSLDPVEDLLMALHLDTCGSCRMKWVRLHRAQHEGHDPEVRGYTDGT